MVAEINEIWPPSGINLACDLISSSGPPPFACRPQKHATLLVRCCRLREQGAVSFQVGSLRAAVSVELFWMLMSGAPTSNSSWSLSAATRSCHWIAIIYSPWSYRFPLIVFLFPLAMLAFFARFPAPVFYGDGLAQPHFQRSITRAKSVLKEAPVPSLKLRRQLCSCVS